MRNYIKSGANVNVPFPYAAASGDAVLVGAALFGVAPTAVKQGEIGALETAGVYTLPKAAGAMALGDKLYWDNTAKQLTKTAAGNSYVAVATRAAIAEDVTVYARLNGIVI